MGLKLVGKASLEQMWKHSRVFLGKSWELESPGVQSGLRRESQATKPRPQGATGVPATLFSLEAVQEPNPTLTHGETVCRLLLWLVEPSAVPSRPPVYSRERRPSVDTRSGGRISPFRPRPDGTLSSITSKRQVREGCWGHSSPGEGSVLKTHDL